MSERFLFSIIIPCYNSEKFVGRAIDSVLAQKFEDCELILVNDGSLDGTLNILQKYAFICENVVCIDQKNQGVSVARNTGIAAARGNYIYFLDSDDYMPEYTLEYFSQCVSTYPEANILLFGYVVYVDGKAHNYYQSDRYDNTLLEGKDMQALFLGKKIPATICSALFSTDLIRKFDLEFVPGLKIGEDIRWLIQTLAVVDKVFYSKRICFHYLVRGDSAMGGYRNNYTYANFNSFLIIKQTLKDCKELRGVANQFVATSYISNLLFYLRSRCWNSEIESDFIRNKGALWEKFDGLNFYVCVIFFFRFLPLRLFFFLIHKFRH